MNMIERMARAMCLGRDADDTNGGPHPQGTWLDEGEAWWTGYVETVQAGLQAIREPTIAMEVAAIEDASIMEETGDPGPVWLAMLDAALADGEA